MLRTTLAALVLIAVALGTSSCRSGAATGTVLGGLLGAGMGTAIDSGHGWGGAAVGAAVGAAAGYALGDYHDEKKQETRIRAARQAAYTGQPVAYRIHDPERDQHYQVEARPDFVPKQRDGSRRVVTTVERWDPATGRWVLVDRNRMVVD